MKSQKAIENMLFNIEQDPRYKADAANVQTNAPLALIQCQLEGQVQMLQWILKD